MRRIKDKGLPWNWKTLYFDIHRPTAQDGQYGILSPYFPQSWINFFEEAPFDLD